VRRQAGCPRFPLRGGKLGVVPALTTPTVGDVQAAGDLVRRYLAVTPLVPSPLLGANVVLKLETLQPTGSFKVRGALVGLQAALARARDLPVVAASTGNHALGVGFAASVFGVVPTVVIPETASGAKRDAIARYPVELIRHGKTSEDAENFAGSLVNEGWQYLSPYNDRDVIAGQGTIGIELLEQAPGLTTIVAPVGGGGLISGLGLAARLKPDVQVIGVEAESSTAMSAALEAGRVVPVSVRETLADGLAGNLEEGSLTVDVTRQNVADMLTVTEDEIAESIRFLIAEHGLVAEGSAAVAVAPFLSGRIKGHGGTVAVVLTGRNILPASLAEVLGGASGRSHLR
jgi:threonine dehydratase